MNMDLKSWVGPSVVLQIEMMVVIPTEFTSDCLISGQTCAKISFISLQFIENYTLDSGRMICLNTLYMDF